MNSSEAELWDWMRIFIGEVPPIFLVEVVLRVIVIYLLLIVSLRIMGKRMSAMVSRNEMIAMVSLAAAIGIPIQDPARGLLPAFIIAGVVIGFQRVISINTRKSSKFEGMVIGKNGPLVEDGLLFLDNMEKSRISRERLLSEFRTREITCLGKIERAYLEPNGAFTVFLFEEERDGLCILPSWDTEFLQEMPIAEGKYACGGCGNVVQRKEKPAQQCDSCKQQQWYQAVRS